MIAKTLGLEGNIVIERAHRVGRKDRRHGGAATTATVKRRTIVVKFLKYKDRDSVLRTYKHLKLWEKRIYVNEDFSERTSEKRRELFQKAKELRESGKYAKVIYNKLITRPS